MFIFGIMNTDKVSDNLKNYLAQQEKQNSVVVIIELSPSQQNREAQLHLSRTEKIALRKDAFEKELKPVAQAINSQGGEVTGSVWLNHTIKANVPPESIPAIAQLKNVQVIDLPHHLTLD